MNITIRSIFLPLFGISLMFFMICLFWKRIYRHRPPILPYQNSQIAFITQTNWSSQPTEQPPPSYYSIMNSTTVSSFIK
ncbi:unnamed protein product [Adineta steineri]|uniref:Uncharacterized protein n=1 Tax=Adineta steineri TaxID=433720 RepID=A0A813YDS0_9BILA|nr:unnamed protein product [Adineta steineri]CAF0885019.1 unnamed protein product [Adineta steineri]